MQSYLVLQAMLKRNITCLLLLGLLLKLHTHNNTIQVQQTWDIFSIALCSGDP